MCVVCVHVGGPLQKKKGVRFHLCGAEGGGGVCVSAQTCKFIMCAREAQRVHACFGEGETKWWLLCVCASVCVQALKVTELTLVQIILFNQLKVIFNLQKCDLLKGDCLILRTLRLVFYSDHILTTAAFV